METSLPPQTITHHPAASLPTLLDDKQQRILDTIAQVGALTPLAIAKTAHQYPRIKDLNQEEVAPTFGLLFTRIAALVGVKGQIDPCKNKKYGTLFLAASPDFLSKTYTKPFRWTETRNLAP